MPGHSHRTVYGVFLSRSDWDAGRLLDMKVDHVLRRMRPRGGEVIYLVIDDTRIPKRGKRMFAVSKIWDHKQQRYIHGHFVLTAAVLFRGVTLPWRLELWLAKRWAIEVLFKELRGDLGLGDYQVRSKDAIERHLHLCGLAHLLLTHHGMATVGAQASKANTQVPLPTMSQRLATLRDEVRCDQLRRLLTGPRHRKLRDKLLEHLRAA